MILKNVKLFRRTLLNLGYRSEAFGTDAVRIPYIELEWHMAVLGTTAHPAYCCHLVLSKDTLCSSILVEKLRPYFYIIIFESIYILTYFFA
jgi:hypothetical protein